MTPDQMHQLADRLRDHAGVIYGLWKDDLNAAADLIDSITTPEGWKLVPVEPTVEMVRATDFIQGSEYVVPSKLYRAMLAVAPQPGDGNER